MQPQKRKPSLKDRFLPHMREYDGTFKWFEDRVDPYHYYPKHVRVSYAILHAIGLAVAPLLPIFVVLVFLFALAHVFGLV
jgi:hypothetical protein